MMLCIGSVLDQDHYAGSLPYTTAPSPMPLLLKKRILFTLIHNQFRNRLAPGQDSRDLKRQKSVVLGKSIGNIPSAARDLGCLKARLTEIGHSKTPGLFNVEVKLVRSNKSCLGLWRLVATDTHAGRG